MLNSQDYYDFLEKLFHRTRVFNTSGTHAQNYLGKIQIGEGCEIHMWNTAVFSKKKLYALLWYVCTKHFCLVKPQLHQQPASLTCFSTSFPLQQQQAWNKQEHHIGQQHAWLRSEGRSPQAGDPVGCKKLVQTTELSSRELDSFLCSQTRS